MAKIVSPVWSSARGSIAGTTYLTTPSGQIIARQRTRPTNAPSPYRTFAKDALIEAVALWSALTPTKRGNWNTWALANPPGTGRQQFIAAQAFIAFGYNAALPGWPVLITYVDPPDFSGHPSLTLAGAPYITPATTGVAFKIRNPSAMPIIYVLEISTGLSQARNYWKGPWDSPLTKAGVILAGANTTISFIVPAAGQRYFARARVVANGVVVGQTGHVLSPALITWSVSVTNP